MRRLARPLLYVGTFAVVLGMGRVHAQYIGIYHFHSSQRLPWTVAYAVVLSLSAYAVGLPDLFGHYRATLAAAVGSVVAGAGAISLAQLLLGSLLLPRFVVGVSALVLIPWYMICTQVANAGSDREASRDRVVAVVGPDEAAALRADLARNPERPASLALILTPDEARPGPTGAEPLVEAVAAERSPVLVLDRWATADDAIVAQAASLHEAGVRVRTLSLFYDEWMGKLPLSELERMSLMFDIGEIHRARYGRLKRLTDVAIASAAGIVLIVVLPFVLIGNLFGNRGPLFYRQQRVGRGEVVYDILKLRTMTPNSGESRWTEAGDVRVTPFGRWLRVSHVDELPQVVNILRGDQAVVGPRPEQPRYVEELSAKVPFYDIRHLVRPGLTGWAQVKYAYGSTEVDALEKLQYEFYYLRHQSLTLDARIIGRTLRHVVGRNGR